MCRITLKELEEVKELLISLLPSDKKDWKQSYLILSEDLNYVINQLELFLNKKQFEFKGEKFGGVVLYIYSTLLEIDRGEHPYLSLEEKDRLIRAKEFLENLWDAIIEKRRQ